MGHKALAATRDGRHGGHGLAVAGLLLSYIGMALVVLAVVLVVLILVSVSGPLGGP